MDSWTPKFTNADFDHNRAISHLSKTHVHVIWWFITCRRLRMNPPWVHSQYQLIPNFANLCNKCNKNCDFVMVDLQGHDIAWDRTAISRWRHQKETFSALRALCAGNSLVTGEFPAQRPVTRSFDGFFDLRLNKRLNKQCWWLETPACPLWRQCNV